MDHNFLILLFKGNGVGEIVKNLTPNFAGKITSMQ